MNQPLLQVDGLKLAYGQIIALHEVSFEVAKGEIVTLIGANGAGKSSTLRAVSRLLPPLAGTIVFDGHDLTKLAPHELIGLGIAHVPEGRGIFGNLTVRENLLLATFQRNDWDGINADIERVFSLFPRLRERIEQSSTTLSGGEQQMLAVGRALMMRAKLLLLDEPSMGLAPILVKEIFRIIVELNKQGATVLLVEQNANMALKISQRAYVLENGRIVKTGSAADLRQSPDIRKAYLGDD
ncbi:MAG: ABC transporter ATP-binding protein [Candidatus Riflebacteria bacterium]|nr:ABC transporter ATP-binding protein [Candidatus Riflebacteria bacterium]